MNAISIVRETTLAQYKRLEEEEMKVVESMAPLEERRKKIQDDKAKLTASLEELDKNPLNKGTKAKRKTKPSKPNAKKPDVRKVCLAVIKANPGINKDKLEERVKHHITKDLGFPLTAVAMLLRQCLSSDEFNVAADGTVSTTLAARVGAVNADPQRVEKAV